MLEFETTKNAESAGTNILPLCLTKQEMNEIKRSQFEMLHTQHMVDRERNTRRRKQECKRIGATL